MLTTKEINNAKPQAKLYRIFDTLGLYIKIHPAGGKWIPSILYPYLFGFALPCFV